MREKKKEREAANVKLLSNHEREFERVRVCVRERKREGEKEREKEREREFNNESKKCKSESEFIEKSYVRAHACPRKHTLPVVIHAI